MAVPPADDGDSGHRQQHQRHGNYDPHAKPEPAVGISARCVHPRIMAVLPEPGRHFGTAVRARCRGYRRSMGAWGEQPFENDDAGDWGYEFDGVDDATGRELLVDALNLGEASVYLESPDGAVAVAAAEVVSWMLDPQAIPTSPYGEAPATWVRAIASTPDAAMVAAALAALDRVRSQDSELAELWAESGDDSGWRESLARIEERLRARI